MLHKLHGRLAASAALAVLLCSLSACTSPREYFRNGFKVGPSYGPPAAPLAKHWIDANDAKLKQQACVDLSSWWGVFNDPLLNRLIVTGYRQNLTLKEAGARVLQARALRGVAVGNIFPQSQTANGSYNRLATTGFGGGNRFFDSWSTDFNLSWELDFWGRYRRAVAAADDNLDVAVANYDQVIVTLLADIAQNYVRIRTDQQRIKYLQTNVELQQSVFDYITKQKNVGFKVSDLEYYQALSNLRQTEAAIPQLRIDQRLAENRLCILLGMPAIDMQKIIGDGPIPTVPPEIVVNLPADLLRQRPDVRSAERQAAAQGEAIGIATADLYPSFFVNGTLGYTAQNFSDLFRYEAFNGSVGPSFRWNVLNYGRILNNIRFQDAHFQELILVYQQTVLSADEEVEDGIVTFLRSQESEKLLKESADAAVQAVAKAKQQYETGAGAYKDLTTYAVIQQNLVSQQDAYAQSIGQIAQGLIQVYRALGGGWEIRFAQPASMLPMAPVALPPGGGNPPAEQVPLPQPNVLPQQQNLPSPPPVNPAVPTEIPNPSDQPKA